MKNKTITCDVLVVGAGVAGVAAAVSAARLGASTVLIEKNNFCGGAAVIAMHRFICGLYPTGLALEIYRGLNKINPESRFVAMGKVKVIPFKTSNLKLILRRMVKSAKNLTVFYHTRVTKVKKINSAIVSISAVSGKEALKIIPKVVIDATGEGVVIKLSGAKYKPVPLKKRQLAGFSVKFKGLRFKGQMLALKVPYYLSKAIAAKKIPAYFKFSSFIFGDTKNEGFCKINIPYKRGFNLNKAARILNNYLRKELPEFRDAYISKISAQLSAREDLSLLGGYILNEGDLLRAKKFPDAVARGNWPIEFWDQQKGQQLKYLKSGMFYEIPLRCLRSQNIKNLFACGRCISATPRALASARVLGTCIASGEAAGIAAKKYARALS